jgi:hypothetical protein
MAEAAGVAAGEADDRQYSPPCERNRQPILEALTPRLPVTASGRCSVLEIASGTGQHAAHFAASLPVAWQPTDYSDAQFRSIVAHSRGMTNVLPPVLLDVTTVDETGWPGFPADSFVSRACVPACLRACVPVCVLSSLVQFASIGAVDLRGGCVHGVCDAGMTRRAGCYLLCQYGTHCTLALCVESLSRRKYRTEGSRTTVSVRAVQR